MINKVKTIKGFFPLINYCLEDKPELTEQQKEDLSQQDHLQHKDRAEVLAYNYCYGDKKELADQFKETAKLSLKVKKPAFHVSLRAAPDEHLSKAQWIQCGQAVAKEFGLQDHQYVIIQHKDAPEEHIHMVANRVGYDGKVEDAGHSYRRLTALCRRLEQEHHLKVVPNPRRYQSPEERQEPRHNQRMDQLKEDIRQTLPHCKAYPDFESRMNEKGYRIKKDRGISFEDEKKARFTGSEIGYPLKKVEKILAENQERALRQELAAKEALQQDREERRPRQSLHL